MGKSFNPVFGTVGFDTRIRSRRILMAKYKYRRSARDRSGGMGNGTTSRSSLRPTVEACFGSQPRVTRSRMHGNVRAATTSPVCRNALSAACARYGSVAQDRSNSEHASPRELVRQITQVARAHPELSRGATLVRAVGPVTGEALGLGSRGHADSGRQHTHCAQIP